MRAETAAERSQVPEVPQVSEVSGVSEAREVPELAGVHEAAEILGVSQQQASHMAKRQQEGSPDAFPEPVDVLAMGPVWLKRDVEAFKETRRRKPGARPGREARPPRTLDGYDRQELERAIAAPETGLTDRQRDLLHYRLGLAGRSVLSPADAAQKIGVGSAMALTEQRRAVEKVTRMLDGYPDDPQPERD